MTEPRLDDHEKIYLTRDQLLTCPLCGKPIEPGNEHDEGNIAVIEDIAAVVNVIDAYYSDPKCIDMEDHDPPEYYHGRCLNNLLGIVSEKKTDIHITFEVFLLNDKGYKTIYSCSGHKHDVTGTRVVYITFEGAPRFDPVMPSGDGWHIITERDEYGNLKTSLYSKHYLPGEDNSDLAITAAREQLRAWVRSLKRVNE